MAVLRLHVESSTSKSGVLLNGSRKSKVSIIHRKKNGDALLHDGKRVFMLPAASISEGAPERSEDQSGKQRLVMVKSLYAKFISGELDYNVIRREIERHGFLA